MTTQQSEYSTYVDETDAVTVGSADQYVSKSPVPVTTAVCEPAIESASQVAALSHDDRETIKQLSLLSLLEYERVRKAEAKRLGVREATLDTEVEAVRKARRRPSPNDGLEEVEAWPEAVCGTALLQDLAETVRRFVICDPETADAVALWIGFSWVIDAVDVAPIAMITAPEKRCGKTRLLEVIGSLAPRPCFASSITAAALFRAIEEWKPTLLIDEADAFLRDKEELRGILNSGHTRRSAFVVRCVGDDFRPKRFSTWGAKAISGIGRLADTLTDRAIPLRLRRKLIEERVAPLREGRQHLHDLTRKLARWSSDVLHQVSSANPKLPDGLHDRAQDNWLPLLKIADVVGGEWPERAWAAAHHLSGGADESTSLGMELLADIHAFFAVTDKDRVFSTELLAKLCEGSDTRWGSFNNGGSLTSRQLSAFLKPFGVESKQIRIGALTNKGFQRDWFDDAFQRYLHPARGRNTETLQASQ